MPSSENKISAHSNIVTLTHEFFPKKGGIATYTKEIANAAHLIGHNIEVWAPRNKRITQEVFPYTIRELPVRGTQSWPCRLRLAKYLHHNRNLWSGQTLYLPEPGPQRAWMYLQSIGARGCGQLIITLHGSEIETFSQPAHRRFLFGKLLQKADRIGVVSNFSKDLLFSKFPHMVEELAKKTVICFGALRSDMSEPLYKNFSDNTIGPIKLLTVGRIHPRKGQLEVVEALARLPIQLKRKCVYKIVGPIGRKHFSYKQSIEKLAYEQDVKIEFMGEIEDKNLPKIYRSSDIFIMASIPFKNSIEGFGLVYLEASAHSLPIIAHDIGGVRDAVKNEVTGLKADPNDRESLTACIKTLIEDKNKRIRLGLNGSKWATSFNWEVTASRLFN